MSFLGIFEGNELSLNRSPYAKFRVNNAVTSKKKLD